MKYLITPLTDGILTGLFLQLALGPVFFFILGITMDSNYINSLFAVTAVTLADCLFILLSLVGVGKLLAEDKINMAFGLVGSIVLILFGVMSFYKGGRPFDFSVQMPGTGWTPVESFTSCFLLTVSSPLTILFWGGIFSTKAIEKNYARKQLAVFGLGAGASTFIFLSLTMLIFSWFKSSIPGLAVQVLNCMVGMVLIIYGISRTAKTIVAIQARYF